MVWVMSGEINAFECWKDVCEVDMGAFWRFKILLCWFGDLTRVDRCWSELDHSFRALDARETLEPPGSDRIALFLTVNARSVSEGAGEFKVFPPTIE